MNSPFELDTIIHERFDPRTIQISSTRLFIQYRLDATLLTRWFDSSLHVHSRLCLRSIDSNLLTPRLDSSLTLIRLFSSHRFDSSFTSIRLFSSHRFDCFSHHQHIRSSSPSSSSTSSSKTSFDLHPFQQQHHSLHNHNHITLSRQIASVSNPNPPHINPTPKHHSAKKKMVRWDADKNAYITGAVLAELKMTISNQIVQAVLDAWRKLIFPCCFCFEFNCDPFACLIFCIVFLMFGFGLSCTSFSTCLVFPCAGASLLLGFYGFDFEVFVSAFLFPRLRFYHCLYLWFLITLHLLSSTSSILLFPSILPFLSLILPFPPKTHHP